ncbi:TPR end-of-group domain-containing protein [Ekhidna sp. To15]|uniref:TPR end-of-group domain-containing protein n=1 Tax=Ekhidna sp. To15 TaxID=3395267 RepID=UPI003F52005B
MKAFIFATFFTLGAYSFAQVPGQVLDTVVCQNDKKQSYALYLPSNYTTDKKWPIIYFFEPAARGSLPVKLYADVAEELGYILACTHNSRNGSYDQSFTAADAIFLDTENRLSIDFDRVILSGFSGGSRLALSLAVISKAAYGVIGVGAAQPPVPAYMVKGKKDFKYAGLVGARDMNYLEHKSFRSYLSSIDMDNILLVSNLTHTWPDPDDFRMSLLWMQEDIDKFQQAVTAKIQAQQDSIPLSDVLDLKELINDESVRIDSKLAKKTLKEEDKIFKKEQQLRNAITDSLNAAFRRENLDNSSLNWVIRKVRKLNLQKDKSDNLQEKMMIDRILNYTGAVCYESGLRMKTQGFTQKALVAFTIWEAVYENTVFANWLKARIYAADQNFTQALDHLEAALKSGKVKKESVYREPDFERLRDEPRFKEIIETYYN